VSSVKTNEDGDNVSSDGSHSGCYSGCSSSVFVSVQFRQLLYVAVLCGFLPSGYGPSTKGKFIITGAGRSCYCYLLLLLLSNQYFATSIQCEL